MAPVVMPGIPQVEPFPSRADAAGEPITAMVVNSPAATLFDGMRFHRGQVPSTTSDASPSGRSASRCPRRTPDRPS